jgi:hypothetical protein
MVESVKNPRLPEMPDSTPETRMPLRSKGLLNNVVSPCGLALISYAFFLFACLIPPSVYSHYMMEPDRMFLDPASILFYTLCVASFVAGAWSISWLAPSSFVDRKFKTKISPTLFLLAPLILGAAATTITDIYLITHYPIIITSLLAQQGSDVKEVLALEVNGHLAFPQFMLMGTTWWTFWRLPDLPLSGWKNRFVKSGLVVAVLLVIASSAIALNRSTLMLAACGLAILYVLRKTVRKQASFKFVLRSGITAVMCIFLLFFSFSFLRGVESWDDQIYTLIGYTAASYNRLAAVVSGDLRYPFAGHGMYLSNVISHSQFSPVSWFMIWPSQIDDWGAQFGAVTRAGLDGRLIWSGAFGYIFSDLGWFSLPFVFGYGLLYGVAWNWIKRGKVLGIVLYPCFGFCALFWVGSNYLLDQPTEILSIVAILLTGYELALVRRPAGENVRLGS